MFLKDSTGNRRFWVIHTENIQIEKLQRLGNKWIIQLWVQLYEVVKENLQCFRLNSDEREQLRINNLRFTEMLQYEEELMNLIDFNSKDKEVYTNKELAEILYKKCNIMNVNSIVLGKTLNKIYDNYPEFLVIKRTNRGVRYHMKIKSA